MEIRKNTYRNKTRTQTVEKAGANFRHFTQGWSANLAKKNPEFDAKVRGVKFGFWSKLRAFLIICAARQ